MKQDGFTIKEMVSDIRSDVKTIYQKVDSIEIQTTVTNGRVNAIEPQVENHSKRLGDVEKKLYWATGVLSIILIIVEFVIPYVLK